MAADSERFGNDILDAGGAARFLGMHEETIRRLARTKQIPAYKVGGVWRFNKSMLYRWADSQQVEKKSGLVLVVDDEESIREVARRVLEMKDFRVQTAPSGKTALEWMEGNKPDVVVLDLKMPGMTGPELLKEIRTNHGSIPVIILTGYPDGAMMMEALAFSPVLLLSKPIDAEQLLEAVRIAI